jgi:TatD DNase family protein
MPQLTDSVQCEMRPSHASAKYLKDAPPLPKAVKKEKFAKGLMVKGRNESATIPHVAYAKKITVEEVCDA